MSLPCPIVIELSQLGAAPPVQIVRPRASPSVTDPGSSCAQACEVIVPAASRRLGGTSERMTGQRSARCWSEVGGGGGAHSCARTHSGGPGPTRTEPPELEPALYGGMSRKQTRALRERSRASTIESA
jgi:hypothetical protein